MQNIESSETAVQAIVAARREVAAASQAKQLTDSEILDLKTQHESQSSPESNDLERLDVEIAELTMELSALNRQVWSSYLSASLESLYC